MAGSKLALIGGLAYAISVLLVPASDAQARGQGGLDVPVMAGGEPGLDTCGSSGQVVGLGPNGDGFLSVRSGPGGRPFRKIDRVHNGQAVTICDERGPWLAVVHAGAPQPGTVLARSGRGPRARPATSRVRDLLPNGLRSRPGRARAAHEP